MVLPTHWPSPYDPGHIDIQQILQGPKWTRPLGTDPQGRDVVSRMTRGSRISLLVMWKRNICRALSQEKSPRESLHCRIEGKKKWRSLI